MELPDRKTVWTIGHSTRSLEEFLDILKSFDIETVADVRHYPGSRKYPQFNKASLEASLNSCGLNYVSMVELGGRRKPRTGSLNTIWKNEAFRGYADYMETPEFKAGIKELTTKALISTTACMCSEAVWWRCHRALISDFLKEKGWRVMHIMKKDTAVEHPFTAVYRTIHGVNENN